MSDEMTPNGASNAAGAASRSGSAQLVSLADNRIDSRELFREAREIIIAHGEETYRLRLTAQNKLILTK